MTFQNQLKNAFQLFEKGNLKEAEHIYQELLHKELSAKQEIQIRFNFGYLLAEQEQLEKALKNYQRVLDLSQFLNDYELILQSHHQMGMVYRVSQQYDDAFAQFQKERSYIDKYFSDNSLFLASNEYEIGLVNLLSNKFEQAKLHLDTSLEHSLKSEDDIMKACAYRGLGDYYRGISKLSEAKEMYKESLQYFKIEGDTQGIAEVEEKLKV